MPDFRNYTRGCMTALALMLSFPSGVMAGSDESTDEKIARAITAAPSDITDNATIMDIDVRYCGKEQMVGFACPELALSPAINILCAMTMYG